MTENELVLHFYKKAHEVLTIIFEHNIPNGKPIVDRHRDFLCELHKIHEDGALEWMCKEPLEQEKVTQQSLFATLLAERIPLDADNVADKEERHED